MKCQNGCTRKRIIITLVILTLLFIWGNSILPSKSSNAISDNVTSAVGGEITNNDMQEKLATTWLTSGHIRKLAHVTEFAVLGAFIFLLAARKEKKTTQQFSSIALFGLLVALTDETIQLFNDRTSEIKDVWIDFAGFAIGCCLMSLALYLHTKRKHNRR